VSIDRFKVAGVVASWWDEVKYELRTLSESDFGGLVDSWVDTIRDALEQDDDTQKNQTKFDPLNHKLVVRLMPEYLQEIADADYVASSIPEKAHPGYILAQIYSGTVKARINQLVGGTTNPHLNVGDIRSFLLPVPPLREQALIAAILDAHNDCIHTEEVYRDKIALQKKGLMHDLLNGKVRFNIANKSSVKRIMSVYRH
jgi:hypothetical protein